MSMPPYDLWLHGREDIFTWFLGPGIGCKGSRLIPVQAAQGAMAWGQYKPSESGSGYDPWSLHVVELGRGRDRRAHLLPRHRPPVPAVRAAAAPRRLIVREDVRVSPMNATRSRSSGEHPRSLI